MKFSSAITILSLFLLFSCSKSVEDKNSGMSDENKKDLKEQIIDDSIQVSSISLDGIKVIRGEDNTVVNNISAKELTVKACLADRNLARSFKNRNVQIDGKDTTTNTDGCLFFLHKIEYDYTSKDRCAVFQKTLSYAGKKLKAIRYSIDYIANNIANLDNSPGCINEVTSKNSQLQQAFRAEDIRLSNEGNYSELRSDKRWLDHKTKISTCLQARKNGEKVSNARIQIKATNRETGEVAYAPLFLTPKSERRYKDLSYSGEYPLTNDRGCFTADIITSYEQYRNSHWMDLDLEITVLTGELAGLSYFQTVYINPWETGDRYGIGEIGRAPITKNFKNEYAKLHLDGVMYIQIGNDEENLKVNDYLGLTLSKTYQVVLNPYVDREHVYSSKADAVNRLVHRGKFKLSMVVLAPKENDMVINAQNYNDFEYITGIEQTVEINNGVINAVVNIPFRLVDLPRLALRTMSIFKLEPLDDTGLRSTIVTGFFKARIPWIKTNVLQSEDLNVPDFASKEWGHASKVNKKNRFDKSTMFDNCSTFYKMSADECADELKNYTEEKAAYRNYVDGLFTRLSNETKNGIQIPMSPKQIYVNHLSKSIKNLKVLNRSEFNQRYNARLSKQDYNAVFPKNKTSFEMPRSLIYRLCIFGTYKQTEIPTSWGMKKDDHKDCLENVYKYFSMEGFRHVKKVNSTSDFYSNGFVMNTNEYAGVNDTNYHSYSESTGKFISADASLKFPVDKLPIIGSFIGAGFKTGTNMNWTDSKTDSQGYTLVENIGTSKTIGIEKFVVNVNAQFERCLLIQSKEHLDSELAEDRRKKARVLSMGYTEGEWGELGSHFSPSKNFDINLYICDDQIVSQDFREAWFFMQSELHTTIGRDYDGQERKLLKVFRGTVNFEELRKALRDITHNKMIHDNVGLTTPDDTLVENWGHLLDRSFSRSEAARFIRDNMDGAFPGTIQGQGAAKAAN